MTRQAVGFFEKMKDKIKNLLESLEKGTQQGKFCIKEAARWQIVF